MPDGRNAGAAFSLPLTHLLPTPHYPFPQHQQLLSWAEMFDAASPAERKLIASHLIKAVTLTRGYGIQIDFNISEAQYLNGMEL